eukprot:jgi/Galph1/5832/GphlegSOOS_G4496.1
MNLSPAKRNDVTPSKLGTPSRVRSTESISNLYSPFSKLHTPRRVFVTKSGESIAEPEQQTPHGLKVTLSTVKASPKQKKELGSDTVLSPVRYSSRLGHRKDIVDGISNASKVREYLEQTGYTYVPNKHVKEGFQLQVEEKKSQTCEKENEKVTKYHPR